MPTYLVAFGTPKDMAKLKDYAGKAAETISAHGGVEVARGRVAAVPVGTLDRETGFIAKFADAESAHDWFHSAEYQALGPLRDAAMDATFAFLDVPD